MNTRIFTLRKSLKLTQKNFGKQIGMTHPMISDMEKGNTPITERTIIAICAKFHVNEEWLRYGNGEMFNITDKKFDDFFEIYQNLSKPLQDFLYATALELLKAQNKL